MLVHIIFFSFFAVCLTIGYWRMRENEKTAFYDDDFEQEEEQAPACEEGIMEEVFN